MAGRDPVPAYGSGPDPVGADATLSRVTDPMPQLRRIVIDVAGRRHDLAMPRGEALVGALASIGVYLGSGSRVQGPDGSPVDLGTPAAQLLEGGLYAVAGPAATPAQRIDGAAAGGSVNPLPWALVGFGIVAAMLAVGDERLRWPTAGVLVLAALVSMVFGVARGGTGDIGAAASLVLAGIGSCLGALTILVDAPVLAFAVAGAAMAVLAALLMVVARTARARAAAAPVVVIAALFAALALTGPMLGWAPNQLLIAASAIAVVGIRAAPSLLVGVDPGYHIDFGRFMVLRWTVRGRVPASIDRIDEQRVREIVAAAEARLDSAILMLAVLAGAGLPAAAPALVGPDPVARIAAMVYVLLAVLALLLTSRRTAAPALRIPPRVAAVTGLLLLAAAVVPQASAAGAAIGAGALLFAALVAAAAVLPLARGERSLGWSRTGDIVDSLAIALVLPAGLLAAGTLDLLRGVLT